MRLKSLCFLLSKNLDSVVHLAVGMNCNTVNVAEWSKQWIS